MLVTHGVGWLPEVDVVVMMAEGRVEEVGSYRELMERNGPFAHYLNRCLTQADEQQGGEGQADQEGNTGILGMVGEGEGGRLQIDPNDEREERERLTRKVTQVSWGWWGRGGGEFTDTQMTRGAD